MDQHEFVHSYLHACKFPDIGRNELVASHPYYFYRQHSCFDSNDFKRSCGSEIRNSIPGFSTCKFWCTWSKCSCHAESYCCLRLVWHSNLDRRLRIIPDGKSVDPID